MAKPRIKAKATCPELLPKSKPEDMEALKEFYKRIDDRLVNIEDDLAMVKCKKLVIEIEEGKSAD